MPEDKMDEKSRACLNDLLRLTIGQKIDPDYLDKPCSAPFFSANNGTVSSVPGLSPE